MCLYSCVDVHLNACVSSPRPIQLTGAYLVPENFQQRNMDLIQSIRNYLNNDESQFNQFKNYSGQFRQVGQTTCGSLLST